VQKRQLPIFFPLGLLFLFMSGMALIQFATPDMPDNDGFYHIKLAQLMRTEGLKPAFPWLPLSILNQGEFYDHHFLFHGALIPFTFGDLRVGAKWAAVIFASLAFLAVWYLLHRQRVPYAWLWALALLGISDAFLYRMSITRAQSLSLALLAIAFAWILEGKYKHLALLSFIYVWMYDAFPLMLALAFLHLISIALIEQRLELRPLLYIAGGIILGLIINPYFPENIIFSYHHMLPKLTDATSVRVGNEWFPYETDQLLRNSLPSLIAFVSGTLALGFSGRKMDVRTAFAFLVTLLFGLMLFQARRFVEYFPPFALIFAAFAWAPLFDVQPVFDISIDSVVQRLTFPTRAHIPAMLLSVAVIGSISRSIPQAREAINNSKPYGLYADASAWLEKNTPPGARVFQTDWDDFPRLFFYNTHNIYLVGLDPTYMQIHDPALYDLWVDITQGEVENPSQIIASQFASHHVHTDLNHEGFLQVAEEDPGLKEVYRDDQAVIFEVVALP
jgi:asparagine N-glycosylation enzyme membrane subunit Stt3